MTFAPSADTTDRPAKQNLFVAHAGGTQSLGGITEVTLAAAAAAVAVPTINATLVQTIATSAFNPGSPDPSGVTYLPGTDRLHIVDSEVEEVTGAGYHGVNMWQTTRAGAVTDTGTTFPAYSKEPTGVAFDAGTNTLFISDDSGRRVHVVKPGPDGRFGNADDIRTFIDAKPLASSDTEDPAFDPVSGHLFLSDAVSTEVYDINPVNGVFGDGNDTWTHFDVGTFGATDSEGLAYNPTNDTLLVGDRTSRKIYEVTKSGSLIRIINAKVGDYSVLSGLTVAPAIDDSGRKDFWIASRGVDNGSNSNENDGKIVEVSIGGSSPVDTPPTVVDQQPGRGQRRFRGGRVDPGGRVRQRRRHEGRVLRRHDRSRHGHGRHQRLVDPMEHDDRGRRRARDQGDGNRYCQPDCAATPTTSPSTTARLPQRSPRRRRERQFPARPPWSRAPLTLKVSRR